MRKLLNNGHIKGFRGFANLITSLARHIHKLKSQRACISAAAQTGRCHPHKTHPTDLEGHLPEDCSTSGACAPDKQNQNSACRRCGSCTKWTVSKKSSHSSGGPRPEACSISCARSVAAFGILMMSPEPASQSPSETLLGRPAALTVGPVDRACWGRG